MSNYLIAFLFAAGCGTWIYNKMYSKTGGNNVNALIVGALSAGLLFMFMLVVLAIVGNMISDAF